MGAGASVPIPAVLAFLVAFSTISLSISSAETGCVEGIPAVKISPSKLVTPPGQTGVFSVDVTNRDSDNCPIKTYKMTGSSTVGSVSFSPSVLHIRPGDSDSALMKVSVPSDAAATIYKVMAKATGGSFSSTDPAELEVRPEVEKCEVLLSSLRFKEKNADSFESVFSKDDEVSVYIDVSLLGNSASDVTLELYADGAVVQSETNRYPANSDTTFRFSNRILTKNYNDNVGIRVVATPSCNPGGSDEETGTIEIKESDEDIDLDVKVGNPASTVVGREVTSRVFIKNNGEKDARVNIDAKLCRNSYGCNIEMFCGDSTFLVEKDKTTETVCKAVPTLPGKYRVEVEVTFEGDEDFENSNDFFVYSTEAELAANRPNLYAVNVSSRDDEVEKVKEVRYVCKGNMKQAIFTTTKGVKVSDIEFCPGGCKDGRCIPKAVTKGAVDTRSGVSEGKSQVGPIFSKPSYIGLNQYIEAFFELLKNLLSSKPS
jgi:hypothetical protein